MSKERDINAVEHTKSSGNVFADLDLPHSEKDMLKVEIARAIANAIERRKLTQIAAAGLLRTDQAKISAIIRGRLKDFSTDRLLGFLIALGHDVEINISRRAKKVSGKIKVYA
ncbi:MAG TPA: helix-turn-helix transcriptional regulator [Rhizomicrobium sp.]|jgi:predicted XRE-type DNA-binding protein|nr:helix-turn-helix transcriptional regulator [Rhizomicrobium sp.]